MVYSVTALLHGWCGCYTAGAVVTRLVRLLHGWCLVSLHTAILYTQPSLQSSYTSISGTVDFRDNIHSSVVLLRVFVTITVLLLGI